MAAQSKNILIINDMPGYGKVALAAMLPVLSTMGLSVYHLPTALVSNLGYTAALTWGLTRMFSSEIIIFHR